MDERSAKYPTYLREMKTEEQLAGGKGHLLHLITRRKCIKEGGHGWLTATCTNSIVVFHLIIIANLLIIKWLWSSVCHRDIINHHQPVKYIFTSKNKTKQNRERGREEKEEKEEMNERKTCGDIITCKNIYANIRKQKQSRVHRWAKTLTQTH